jgi:hypothetical protein
MAAVGVSLALPAGRAAGASPHAVVTWACEPTDATTAEVKAALLAACGATEGKKTVCAVLSGTPFACNDSSVTGPVTEPCSEQAIDLTATGGTGSVLGWSVEGEVTISGSVKFTKTVKTCELTPKVPPPTGAAGTFVKEQGTASASASFSVTGTGKVTFLGGTIFSTTETSSCNRTMGPIDIYASDSAAGCEAPTPTTTCERDPAACVTDPDREHDPVTTPSTPITPSTPSTPPPEEPGHGP